MCGIRGSGSHDAMADAMTECIRILLGRGVVAESSLTIMIYYFTRTTDWAAHLQARGDINLAILDVLAELGVEIALPSRTVHLREEGPACRS